MLQTPGLVHKDGISEVEGLAKLLVAVVEQELSHTGIWPGRTGRGCCETWVSAMKHP